MSVTKKFIKNINTTETRELINMKISADDMFFNSGEPSGFSDEQYDFIVHEIERRGEVKYDVGMKIRDGENRVKLPRKLWSMNKVTSECKLKSWLVKNPADNHTIQEKLDGVSCMIVYEKGHDVKLYTRGDGSEGGDISHLSDKLFNIPDMKHDSLTVRGELIIPKSVFVEKWSESFANARNMVSGCVNAKLLKVGVGDIHFVAYEVIGNVGEIFDSKPDQLEYLESIGFECVRSETTDVFNGNFFNTEFEMANMYLSKFKDTSKYEIDGIILQPVNKYIREEFKNPSYTVAFKRNDMFVKTKIVDVFWEVTKWMKIKPRVQIDPIEIGGATITFVSAHNAKYVVDNGIGIGATISVTRSGDVIPYIVNVDVPVTPVMPDFEYKWNETKVDIFISGENETSDIKKTKDFFDKVGIKQLGEKTILKLYEGGYNSIKKICEMTELEISNVDGFGATSAKRIYNNIREKYGCIPVGKFVASSGIMGAGMSEKRVNLLIESYPMIFEDDSPIEIEAIMKIDGFSTTIASQIVTHLSTARELVFEIKFMIKETIHNSIDELSRGVNTLNLNQLIFVFSGFRNNEDLEGLLKVQGHKVGVSVSSKTNFVIIPKIDSKPTTKTKRANELGIKIITIQDVMNGSF